MSVFDSLSEKIWDLEHEIAELESKADEIDKQHIEKLKAELESRKQAWNQDED